MLLATAFLSQTNGQAVSTCSDLNRLIKSTYNFKPSRLSASEQKAKSDEMDRIWNAVKLNPKELLPCLRDALKEPAADQWFRFDGSMLLVSVDPSPHSKVLEVSALAQVDLDDVNLRAWTGMVSSLALEGFDISPAAERWLSYPKGGYSLPEHGGYEVDTKTAALFIFGSMDEAQATPALIKIIGIADHRGRDIALWLLAQQATDESLQALKSINLSTFSGQARRDADSALKGSKLLRARSSPKTTRGEFLRAFQQILNNDFSYFAELVEKVPDGERDVVAVMKPEDLPLIRKVRRRIISQGNQHAVEYYDTFTQILMTLIWKQSPK